MIQQWLKANWTSDSGSVTSLIDYRIIPWIIFKINLFQR